MRAGGVHTGDLRFRSRPVFTVLAVVVSILCVVVEVQLYRSYVEANRATQEFRRTTDAMTALANVQRETFKIHTAISALEEGDDLKKVEIRRALLERQLDVYAGAVDTIRSSVEQMAPMERTLRVFDRQVAAMSDASTARGVKSRLPRTKRTLDRFEIQVKELFDDEEHELYTALTTTLHQRGARQRMIVLVGALGLLILGAAAFFIRRSIRTDFARAFNELAREVQERKALQDQLSHQALHDSLTGLANRALFRDELHRRRSTTWVLYIDLDGFKTVNDSFGHDAGDELLCEASNRLRECVRPEDLVARLGGDEFSVLLTGASGEADARSVADRLLAAMSMPFEIYGKRVGIGASIGIAEVGSPGADPDEVLRDADLAMYAAKKDGKGSCRLFSPELRAAAETRAQIEDELRSAIEQRELELHYQPIIDLERGAPVGFEALVRWRHPVRGLLFPGAFLDVAEESGLMLELGRQALRDACREAVTWPLVDGVAPWISVNLSPRQLRDPDLPGFVRETLAETGLAPERLTLEISEMTVLSDQSAAARALAELRELGLHLAMDDFGAGYSSFGYLRFLPIDVLKIDKCWIDEIAGDSRRSRVARAIMRLGEQLHVATIAEGVETQAQVDALREAGCRLAQGFFFSPAVPAADVPAMLARASMAPVPVTAAA